jgi:hypothetical protein
MNTSTKLTLLVCSLGLALGGCARTSPDTARPQAPDDNPSYSEEVPVNDQQRPPPTPDSDLTTPEDQDIDEPDNTAPNDPNLGNPGAPPPSNK